VYLISEETLLWLPRSQSQLISTAGWSKLDFAESDQCKPVLLRLSLALEIWKNQLCPSMGPNGGSAAFATEGLSVSHRMKSMILFLDIKNWLFFVFNLVGKSSGFYM
jgi:hypothetical protein